MRKRKTGPRDDEIAAPSRIEPGHVKNRAFITDQGQISQKKPWRRIPPLQAAFERGQLSGGSAKYKAENRLAAGLDYGVIFDRAGARERLHRPQEPRQVA